MTPTQGHVYLDGEQIQRFNSKEVARRIGLLAQNATTPGDITVQELVSRGRYPHQPLFTRWRQEDDRAVQRAMQATGVADLALQSVDTLSGGQRQRAWIAMVLAQETAIMLLDEPTTWLDISYQIDVLELLSEAEPREGLHPGGGAARPEPGLPLCYPSDCPAGWKNGGPGGAERDCDGRAD